MIKYMAIPEDIDIIRYKIESDSKKRLIKKMKEWREANAPDGRSLISNQKKEKEEEKKISNYSKEFHNHINKNVFSRLYENPMEIRVKHTRNKISNKNLNTKKQKSVGELL